MMNFNKKRFRIAELMALFFVDSQTDKEEKELEIWIQERENNRELKERLLKKETYEKNLAIHKKFSVDEAWAKIEPQLDKKTIRLTPWRSALKYAAIILIFSSLGYYFWTPNAVEKLSGVNQEIVAGTTGAKLTLGDGRVIGILKDKPVSLIETNGATIIANADAIDYSKQKPQGGYEVINTIETPKGMEYTLILSDGTKVSMNAGSQLEFPVQFKGDNRVVRLSGEAYFEVTKDKEHPFIVKSKDVEIEVLGTSFNFRSYKNETKVSTTLIEGSVKVTAGGKFRLIRPGEQALFSRTDGNLAVNIVDAEFYTSWKSGKFLFRNERLEDVLKSLSKWYTFDYHFEDEQAKSVLIGASLDRYENMNPIINLLKSTKLVNIKQVNNTIYISSIK